MILYVQTFKDEVHKFDNVVSDVVEIEVEGYEKIEAELPLPKNILGGYYTLEDGKFVFQEELKKMLDEEQKRYDQAEFDSLKNEVEILKAKIEELEKTGAKPETVE